MGRKTGIVAITLAAFLLALAALSRFYIYDRVAVAPLTQDAVSISETRPGADAEYLDVAAGPELVTGPLRSVRTTRSDAELTEEASDRLNRDIGVWHSYVCTDTPDFDCASGDTPLSATDDTVAFDRRSGEAVNWSGASHETGGVSVRGPFQGLYFKFPFDTQQQDYQFWDGTLKEATTATFEGETEVDGLDVYEFVQVIEPTAVGTSAIPGALIGDDRPTVVANRIYQNTRTLLVEPATGVIIVGSESQDSYLEVDGERVLTTTQADLTYTDQTVADNIDRVGSSASLLTAIRSTIPLVGGLLGIVLLGVGVIALTRPPSKPKQPTARPGTGHRREAAQV